MCFRSGFLKLVAKHQITSSQKDVHVLRQGDFVWWREGPGFGPEIAMSNPNLENVHVLLMRGFVWEREDASTRDFNPSRRVSRPNMD